MKPTVSFDVDDVLADFHKKFRALAESMFPDRKLPVANGWDQPNWPLTDAERTLLSMTWKTQPNFYRDLDLCPGVRPMYFKVLADRAHIIFVTSRHHHPLTPAYGQTRAWITEKLGIENPVVVVTDDKPHVLQAARAIVHVDDNPHTLGRLPTEAILPEEFPFVATLGILMRAHHNQSYDKWGYGSLAENFDVMMERIDVVLRFWENHVPTDRR